jgi:hypothetical protein
VSFAQARENPSAANADLFALSLSVILRHAFAIAKHVRVVESENFSFLKLRWSFCFTGAERVLCIRRAQKFHKILPPC